MSTSKPLNQIAIYGGTFDPIHNGHINSATQMANWLGINQVRLMPAHIPPHKTAATASSDDRAAMVQLVCTEQPLFQYDDRELNRERPSYTVETLAEFKQQYPDSQLLFFIGMDSLLSFTKWYQWQKILEQAHLIVSTRPGFDIANINQETQLLLKKHQVFSVAELQQQSSGNILIFSDNHWDISSTQIRERITQHHDLSELLPQSVIHYIQQHQLYQNS